MDDKLLLLGLLRRQEMHGYQLFEFIERGLSACTDLKKPAAYYLLGRMAQDGWLTESITQEGNRPPRKVYRLTNAGEVAFQDLLRENLSHFNLPGLSGDIGLAFLDQIQPDEAHSLLQKRRLQLQTALAAAYHVPLHKGSFQLILNHQLHLLRSELDWLDALIEQIKNRMPVP